MKLNAGIITEKLAESKAFYTQVLQFGVTFENDFYLLLHTPNQEAEISFCCLITLRNSLSSKTLLPTRVYTSPLK